MNFFLPQTDCKLWSCLIRFESLIYFITSSESKGGDRIDLKIEIHGLPFHLRADASEQPKQEGKSRSLRVITLLAFSHIPTFLER